MFSKQQAVRTEIRDTAQLRQFYYLISNMIIEKVTSYFKLDFS